MNRKRDDLRLLMDELLAAVREARLQHEELLVNLLLWASDLISLVDLNGAEPAAEFLALPAQLAARLSRGLTDLGRGELVCRLEALGVERAVIMRQLQIDDRRVRALRQMARESEAVKAALHEHDIPESLYRLFHSVPCKRPLAPLLHCLGRVKARVGRFPSCKQATEWERAVRKNPERDAYELLLEVLERGIY